MKIALAMAYFVFAILLNSVGTVMMQVQEAFAVGKGEATQLEAYKDLTIALTSFLVAPFLPRLGFKNAILGGLALAGLACCLMPTFPSFFMAKALFFLCGLSFAFVKVSVYSSVALVTDDSRQHASFMSTVEGVYMVGVLSGYWVFSYFIDSADPASPVWLNVYWVLAVICAAVVLAVLVTPFAQGVKTQEVSFAKDFLAMTAMMAMPLVCIFIISAFLYVLIEQGIGTWLPTFNKEILGLPSAMSVQATSIFAACLAVGRLSAGAVIARLGWYPVLNICLVIMGGLILSVMPLTHGLLPNPEMSWGSAPKAAFLFPLIGLFMAPIYPALSSVMLSSLAKERHSAMTGLIVIFSALGGTTGSVITGYVFEHFSGQQAFLFSLAPIAGILVTLVFFRRLTNQAIARQERDSDEGPTRPVA
jgi:fucose permease